MEKYIIPSKTFFINSESNNVKITLPNDFDKDLYGINIPYSDNIDKMKFKVGGQCMFTFTIPCEDNYIVHEKFGNNPFPISKIKYQTIDIIIEYNKEYLKKKETRKIVPEVIYKPIFTGHYETICIEDRFEEHEVIKFKKEETGRDLEIITHNVEITTPDIELTLSSSPFTNDHIVIPFYEEITFQYPDDKEYMYKMINSQHIETFPSVECVNALNDNIHDNLPVYVQCKMKNLLKITDGIMTGKVFSF